MELFPSLIIHSTLLQLTLAMTVMSSLEIGRGPAWKQGSGLDKNQLVLVSLIINIVEGGSSLCFLSFTFFLFIVPLPGCGDPGVPSNARKIGDVYSVGSVVFFRCYDDYDIVGSKYRVCQENGVWSGTQPTCQSFNGM